jgi:hypothetical protein
LARPAACRVQGQFGALQMCDLAPEHTSGMPADSHRERVVAAIRISSRPLDDDQIAARTGISPRQTVNQICRALERAGMVVRRPGPDNKIVNEWLGDQDSGPRSNPGPASGAVSGTGALAGVDVTLNAGVVPAGNSVEQRSAERAMLNLLGVQLGCELNPATITVPSGERVEVDGTDANRTVLVECWAHQGTAQERAAAQGPGRCLQTGLDSHHLLSATAADPVPERPAGSRAVPAWRTVLGSPRTARPPHRCPRRQPSG